MKSAVTCATLVIHNQKILCCHATWTVRWDLPKGLADEGESHRLAASRELLEETSLVVDPSELHDFGQHSYNYKKDIHLFGYHMEGLLDVNKLKCTSFFNFEGQMSPEVDRYLLVTLEEFCCLTSPSMKTAITTNRGAIERFMLSMEAKPK